MKGSSPKVVPKVIYSFSAKGDGEHPNSVYAHGFARTPYYGTTAGSKSVSGTVFAFVPGQGLTTLYAFKNPNDGATPNGVTGGITYGEPTLFGATLNGGPSGYGTLYELIYSGSAYSKTTLHSFTGGGSDGAYPQGPLAAGYYPTLYGVTKSGGAGGCGTIFSIDSETGNYSLLYSFTCGDDGAYPEAPLAWSAYGNILYGTTSAGGTFNKGVVFSYKP